MNPGAQDIVAAVNGIGEGVLILLGAGLLAGLVISIEHMMAGPHDKDGPR